jgi:hypothetical protein
LWPGINLKRASLARASVSLQDKTPGFGITEISKYRTDLKALPEQTSALNHLKYRVQVFEFDAGVFCCEPPVCGHIVFVAAA